ncbi:MAG: PrsW family glutamic-type intramembrane protease [Lentimicrobium sp.]|jgi:RsiW-degrading membrane proteinase PrsW (M82 family)|nr:PrsW family glutamic-type intramembrane protease [Lentimicrobium sp.]
MDIRYLLLLISPVLFVLLLLLVKRRYPTMGYRLLMRSAVYGLLIIIPVIALDWLAREFNVDGSHGIRRMFFYSFIVVGFVIETAKFLPLIFDITRTRSFLGAEEGIIQTTAMSLAFTTLYAVYGMFMMAGGNSDLIFLITMPFMNVIFSIILGFFIGMGKMRRNRFVDSMTGLGAAIFFHGIYRFTLLSDDGMFLIIFAAGSLLIAVILLRRSVYIRPDSN